MKQSLTHWMHRIGNARKIKNSRKSLSHQIARAHEEVSEMFVEHRKASSTADYQKITYKKDKFGVDKPHGFAAEWGDAMNQLLHIADLTGIDPDVALEVATAYHEAKQMAKPKKTKKGKKK